MKPLDKEEIDGMNVLLDNLRDMVGDAIMPNEIEAINKMREFLKEQEIKINTGQPMGITLCDECNEVPVLCKCEDGL